jgi:hypothetical protein
MGKDKDKKTLRIVNVGFDYNKKLVGKSTDVRIYRDVIILTEGTFTDSITMEPVFYPSDMLRNTVNRWNSNYLNIDHSNKVLDRIGTVENARWNDGKVMADLYIHPITQNSIDAINLIDQGLINWLSVEILTNDSWDRNDDRYVNDMEYLGLAVVTSPADPNTRINKDGPSPPSWMYD